MFFFLAFFFDLGNKYYGFDNVPLYRGCNMLAKFPKFLLGCLDHCLELGLLGVTKYCNLCKCFLELSSSRKKPHGSL